MAILVFAGLVFAGPGIAWAQATACDIPDNGSGTVDLPPANCAYLSPGDVHMIIDGLPPGTTIRFGAQHSDFFQVLRQSGGNLGGEIETFLSHLGLDMEGTGVLTGYTRTLGVQTACETHVGPRTPGDPVQSFFTDMFRVQGQITGDPDFDLLRVTAGTAFGLPSPGHTTLTRQPGGNWAVDSFFDITYRIDFVGGPGGPLAGLSGSTTGTIHMATGNAASPAMFVRGDANADGKVDISDPISVLGFQFLGGPPPPCMDSADANDDGTVDISDAVWDLSYTFLGSAPPPPPFPACGGPDPSDDALGCADFPPCG